MNNETHMRAALSLARRSLGECAPNPAVGCVIVKDGQVIGRGRTAPGGRPHAETQALAMAASTASDAARGAVAYVTLEPCAHYGATPPCARALVEAGVAHVVVAVRDPDARVNGQGIAILTDAGIKVTESCLEAEAIALNAGFFSTVQRGRPWLRLKLATTLDGRIATRTGESRWISGEPARRATHAMRGSFDAVMVGVGTVLADDPDLACRVEGYQAVPVTRIILDSHLRTPLTSRLVTTADMAPVIVLHRDGADEIRAEALRDAGVRVLEVAAGSIGIDLGDALAVLAREGLTRVLAEGGATLAAALLRADLADELAWFHAPSVMGGDGFPAAQGFGITELAAMPRFRPVRRQPCGEDMLSLFERSA
jgi:diaminohydroxyphosphoribosylaminopyrimidine deaminase/5-amino-6-(5-phosphoribosylamino)uracil reductase